LGHNPPLALQKMIGSSNPASPDQGRRLLLADLESEIAADLMGVRRDRLPFDLVDARLQGCSGTLMTMRSALSTVASPLSTCLPVESRTTMELNLGSNFSLKRSVTSFGALCSVPPAAGTARTRCAWANVAVTPVSDRNADAAKAMIDRCVDT
jgi:hypothetical protein